MPLTDPGTSLSQLLSPMGVEEFFTTYWTRKFLHIPGRPGKFEELFSWEVLNKALEEHRFDAARLRLVKAGRTIPEDANLRGRQVHSANLVTELSGGATLIFNGCDEVHAPLRSLCANLEQVFQSRVLVNLYAGFRQDNGFDVHWDAQDNFIAQVSGRKKWKVWNPTVLYPLVSKGEDKTRNKPTEEPLWEGILEPGDLLSIPRGWWHVAYPIDEPCLHLTVTVPNLTGIDMLHWLADAMKSSEAARMPVPVVASPEERKYWLDRVFADLTSSWDRTLIDRFLAHEDAQAKPRPRVRLPDAVLSGNQPIQRDTLLELATPRPVHFSVKADSITAHAEGTSWQTDHATAEKLKRFNDFRPHTIAELSAAPDLRIHAAIGVMLMRGIIRRTPIDK